MRMILGALVIILAVLMGYSASRYKGPEIQADIDARTEQRLASTEAAAELAVDTGGRHVTLRGYASSEAEKEQIIEQAEGIWGALGPIDEIELLGVVKPYKVSIAKEADGRLTLRGVVPSEAARLAMIEKAEALFGEQVDSELTLAAGAPGGDWLGVVLQGMDELAILNHGRLQVVDSDIELSGEVPRSDDVDRIEALKAEASDGFSWSGVLDVERPTVSPSTFAVDKPGDFWTVDGYAPNEMTRDQRLSKIQAMAGDAEVKADIKLADGRPGDDWSARTDAAIETTDRTFADGSRRTNPLSGTEEEYRRGFWLPVTTIEAGLDACRTQTSLILATNKITFLVGEARLDAQARSIINDLSSVAIGCLDGSGDLRLEIGGHTDSQGADDMNLKLSQARAEAVLTSLIARGVSADALAARGYGETQPIADNATVEGRSANRRITFDWLNVVQQADG